MTITIQDFIKDKLPAVVVGLEDSLVGALKRMIENDFSQLPVIDESNRPLGIITSDSILQALSNLGVRLDQIPIRHVILRSPTKFDHNRDLFDLFDGMNDGYALIVNEDGYLVGIITSYDLTEYFRQRAQDILMVENIESLLKDYVQYAFGSEQDSETKLARSIENLASSKSDLKNAFQTGLKAYLSRSGDGGAVEINNALADQIFQKIFQVERPPLSFDDLTLADYISLFFHRDYWSRFEGIFELEKEAFSYLLNSVRSTRNDLAHFREIRRDQSRQLRYCYDLLVRHEQAVTQAFVLNDAYEEGEKLTEPSKEEDIVVDHRPVADEPQPGESRYAPLAIWLQAQPRERKLIRATFSDIEEIIGGKLPESAYNNRSWWANDSVGHVQSKQWLDVGWRVAGVNMTEHHVRFARIKEREKAYIDFYSELINELRNEVEFSHLRNLPDGASWHHVKGISVNNRGVADINLGFGRGATFRVELYIDSNDHDMNKGIFDQLYENREEIEESLGHELAWSRLSDKRASRIARVFKGHITDDPETLAKLRRKVVPALVNFTKVIEPRLRTTVAEIA